MGSKDHLKSWAGKVARNFGYEVRKIRKAPPVLAGYVPIPEGVAGINYGCGANAVPGWLNVDYGAPSAGVSPSLHFLAADLSGGHPFADASFALGYAEDFLEHLSQAQSLAFLVEAHRTLRVGGKLRLSFPGLEGVLRKHYIGSSSDAVAHAQWDAYDKWGHVHFYSREELRLVAGHVGFRAVEFTSYQESLVPALARMDTRIAQADLNTYVELTK